MSGQLGSELEPLLESLADRIAGRVCERLMDYQAVAQGEHSPWMGIEQTSDYLGWPKQRLYKLTASGEIPHYKHEGRLLFHRSELDSWLSRFAEGQRSEIASVVPDVTLLSPSMTTSEDSGEADTG